MIEFSQNADVTNKCNPPPPKKKTDKKWSMYIGFIITKNKQKRTPA